MAMSKEDLKYFEDLINEKKNELLKELGQLREPGVSNSGSVEDHTPYSYHMADQGTDNMEREKNTFSPDEKVNSSIISNVHLNELQISPTEFVAGAVN